MKALIPLLAFLFMFACSGEDEAMTYDDIAGEWELTEAKRNGRVTTTFQKSIFTFREDSVLETNIPALKNLGKVELSGTTLVTDSNKMKDASVYMKDSTNNLVLEANIKDYKFVFTLKKR